MAGAIGAEGPNSRQTRKCVHYYIRLRLPLLKVSTEEVLPRRLEGGIKNFSRLAAG